MKATLILVVKDTETTICDAQVPHVDTEVISRQIGLSIAVNRDRVDMVRMSIRENPPWTDFYHEVCWL